MTPETLAGALEREHREIDAGIEGFLATRAQGNGRAAPLLAAMGALRQHIFLEEEFLFPPLRASLVAPIFVMLREHGEIWDSLDAIEAHLSNTPEGGASDELCRELLALLERHNSKEEAIIYPQADAVLDASASPGLREFLAAGQIPDGWVCAQASASAIKRERPASTSGSGRGRTQ